MVINGMHSDWELINSGVPEGSVLRPFYSQYTRMLFKRGLSLQVSFWQITPPYSRSADLNHDLKLISRWASQWETYQTYARLKSIFNYASSA